MKLTTKSKLGITLAGVLALIVTTASAGIIIDYVPVGNAGNAADTSTGFGSVGYNYNIGMYEVTLFQYTEFLNAVAASDPNSLYNASMGTDLNIAGISRSGVSGGYTYAVVGDGNRPVTYVSMLDAMRMANWVNNGQGGAGTTETGAYTLSLGGLAPRNGGASVVVASEDEWYKAAYYDPTKGGSNYWQYATRSDSAPGNVVGAGANQANYDNGVFSVTQSGSYSRTQDYLTAGVSYSGSGSYYGTYDQNGNVHEWNDTVIGSNRGLRGGSWAGPNGLESSLRNDYDPSTEFFDLGFRLASIPEPGTALFGVALCVVSVWRRRRGPAH